MLMWNNTGFVAVTGGMHTVERYVYHFRIAETDIAVLLNWWWQFIMNKWCNEHVTK
jgi:hypothetical protein